jgi:fatty-acyl-CoA synthase
MKLWERLTSPGALARQNWGWDGSAFQERTYGEIFESARHAGAGLGSRGVQAGDVVPAVLTNGLPVPAGILGIWMAGATVASLPIPARGMSPEHYGEQIHTFASLLGAEFILLEERFLSMLPVDTAALGIEFVSFESLQAGARSIEPEFLGPLDTALVQFSSGTTGEPRGVELTSAAIDAQLERLANAFAVGPGDVGYSWLPMSHDMGLIGCGLLGWYSGMNSVLSTPERFLQSPRTWLADCAELGVTVTAAAPFALDLAVRADKARPLRKRLKIRQCILGAERIDWYVLEQMVSAFGDRGCGLNSLTAAYGLSEATLAVTAGDPKGVPSAVDVDLAALADGSVQIVEPGSTRETMRVVSVGKPLPGMSVAVDGEVGEVLVDSPSLAKGYFKNEAATAERFSGNGFKTADIGFQHEGQLFVTGRADDLIILGGRNIYVEAIEEEIADQKGIRKGNCAIVSTQCRQGQVLGLVAEIRSADNPDLSDLDRLVRRQVMSRIGASVDMVVFLPAGTFPKTPSGKVQRYRCRQILREQADRPGATVGGRV